ncbi:MAG: hypothetical protein WC812_01245 [Candidatus Pacearchaeota archaeon]|jgi:uncharacterized membrane protein YeaQ/YmgE (transglycosylase-associated protein family)
MKISKSFFNFNKEIIFGEIGAIFGAQIFGYVFSKTNISVNWISGLIVLGSIIGASLFWTCTRIYDKFTRKEFSRKKFGQDILYFTPAAFLLTCLIYYPSLFTISKHLLLENYKEVYSIALSQLLSFLFFLISINLYRYILSKMTKKEL